MKKLVYLLQVLLLIPCFLNAQMELVSISNQTSKVFCNGSISFLATGDAGRFSAELCADDGEVLFDKQDIDGPATFSSLCAGSYILKIRDRLGCVVEFSAEVYFCKKSKFLSNCVTLINPSTCDASDGSIGIGADCFKDPNALFTNQYEWSNGATSSNIGNLIPGTYTLKITNEIGCNSYHTFDLPTLTNPEITIDDPEGCNSPTLTANGEGPFNFVWSDIGYTCGSAYQCGRKFLESGHYQVTVFNVNQAQAGPCSEVIDFHYEEDVVPIKVEFRNIVGSCTNEPLGSFEYKISGGIPPYNCNLNIWNSQCSSTKESSVDDSEWYRVENFCSGEIRLDVIDDCGQEVDQNDFATTEIPELDTPDLKILEMNIWDCDGNGHDISIQNLNLQGFDWVLYNDDLDAAGWGNSTSSIKTFTGLPKANYRFEATSLDGCSDIIEFELRGDPPSLIEVLPPHIEREKKDVVCTGNNAPSISPQLYRGPNKFNHLNGDTGGAPPLSYTWYFQGELFSNSRVIENLENGTYSFYFRDGCGFETSQEYVVNCDCDINPFELEIEDPCNSKLFVDRRAILRPKNEAKMFRPLWIDYTFSPTGDGTFHSGDLAWDESEGTFSDVNESDLGTKIPLKGLFGKAAGVLKIRITDSEGCDWEISRNIDPRSSFVWNLPERTINQTDGESNYLQHIRPDLSGDLPNDLYEVLTSCAKEKFCGDEYIETKETKLLWLEPDSYQGEPCQNAGTINCPSGGAEPLLVAPYRGVPLVSEEKCGCLYPIGTWLNIGEPVYVEYSCDPLNTNEPPNPSGDYVIEYDLDSLFLCATDPQPEPVSDDCVLKVKCKNNLGISITVGESVGTITLCRARVQPEDTNWKIFSYCSLGGIPKETNIEVSEVDLDFDDYEDCTICCSLQGNGGNDQITIRNIESVDEKMILYPNPTSSDANIKMDNLRVESAYKIVISDYLGVIRKDLVIKTGYRESESHILKSFALNLDSGLYFVSLVKENQIIQTQKFIKL